MLTRNLSTKIVGAFFTVCGLLSAQVPNPTQHMDVVNTGGSMPVYTVTVVERATKTINYHNRGGATKIDFRGTPLLPKAHGEAKVESKQGYIEIEVEFRELQSATMFGSEYLTYVMWAITPEGRTSNLGEILLNGQQRQGGRDDRAAVLRLDRDGGALLRGDAAERRGRDGKRDPERHHRGG